jgi:hypothetical protein
VIRELAAEPVPLPKLDPPLPLAVPPTNVALGVVELGEDLPHVLPAADQPLGGLATSAAPAVKPVATAVAAVPALATAPPVPAVDGLTAHTAPLAPTQSLPVPLAAPSLKDPPVKLELGEHLASVLQTMDQPIERTARELMVLELYRQGRTSSDNAAELLGVSKADFMKHVSDLSIDENTSTACLSGLTSVLDTVREDLRAMRLMFASNLILAFSIPIATLALANRDVFFVDRLTVRFFGFSKTLPWDFAQVVFCTWTLAILVFGFWVVPILLGKTKSEKLAESDVKQATEALARNDIAVALGKVSTAVTFYIESASETLKARRPFQITFALFVICIGIEFALCLFSPLPNR